MTTRRLTCLLLVLTLAVAHWGRAAACHCQHTAKQLPHVHLSELTFGLLGKTDSESRCGCCHAHHAPENAPVNDPPAEEDDVIYLPAALDHDWRTEPATDLLTAPVAAIGEAWPFAPTFVLARHPAPTYPATPARCPALFLTNTLLI